MAFTQMQLIQSLGEAMAWFEREIAWGVPPTELRHLCGRIGELYAALVSNGQMVLASNQHGYDVVSDLGERISVKTTAVMGSAGHVAFNPRSLDQVDRIMVLRINTEEMQVETLLDAPLSEALGMMTSERSGKRMLPFSRLMRNARPRHEIKSTHEVHYGEWTIRELESGTIELERDGSLIHPVRPMLRNLAAELNLSLVNGNDNPFNTRQLGSQIIKHLEALAGTGLIAQHRAAVHRESDACP